MSTSDAPFGSDDVAVAQLTKEIDRLARELFTGTGPAPYAANAGAGGVSPAAAPGFPDEKSLGPLVPEGAARLATPADPPVAYFVDLAGPPGPHGAQVVQQASPFASYPTAARGGTASPLAAPGFDALVPPLSEVPLQGMPSQDANAGGNVPYFLELAGPPGPHEQASPLASSPTAARGGGVAPASAAGFDDAPPRMPYFIDYAGPPQAASESAARDAPVPPGVLGANPQHASNLAPVSAANIPTTFDAVPHANGAGHNPQHGAYPAGANVPAAGKGGNAPADDPKGRGGKSDAGRGANAQDFTPEATAYRPELVPEISPAPDAFDAHAVKRDFPILQEQVRGRQIVWLDNAATTQKPNVVIERIAQYYRHENSNVHRAAHTLAARATDAYEAARKEVRRFLNASSVEEIVFVRGATEGINLVAQSWGRRHVNEGDEILITHLEHHANIVPWQMLCREKHARLRVAPVDDRGQIILEEYERLLNDKTRIVALPQVSNALGTIVPAREMVEMAHRWGARVLVDGAQAVSHMPVDVQFLDCDFYAFSGHKIFAPTGIGVVYGKRDVLAAMPPWQGGGNMIADVTFEKTTYQPPPGRFEAGTGSIADAVGLGAALEWLSALGLPNVARHEHELRVYGEECLSAIPGLQIIGTAPEKAGVISFVLDGVRTEDVGGLLDLEGIAVRSGHHCAQPILRRFGLESTVRASLAPYNTREDIDALVAAVRRLQLGRPG